MDEAPLTHETASLLATLRVAGAPLLASLPLELLHGIFTAGGLDQAYGWRFEEQRKTERSLIVDAVCMCGNFTDNTHEEGTCYRLEGRAVASFCDTYVVRVPRFEVYSLRHRPYVAYGYYASSLLHRGPPRWLWTSDLEKDPLFQRLLETRRMQQWLKHCEEHFCK